MTNRESAFDAVAPRLGIHARAMAFGVRVTDDAMLVEWQAAQSRQLTRQHQRLIEAALAFAIGMQWNWNDNFRVVQRVALLCLEHQRSQTVRYVRFPFQLQNRSA